LKNPMKRKAIKKEIARLLTVRPEKSGGKIKSVEDGKNK